MIKNSRMLYPILISTFFFHCSQSDAFEVMGKADALSTTGMACDGCNDPGSHLGSPCNPQEKTWDVTGNFEIGAAQTECPKKTWQSLNGTPPNNDVCQYDADSAKGCDQSQTEACMDILTGNGIPGPITGVHGTWEQEKEVDSETGEASYTSVWVPDAIFEDCANGPATNHHASKGQRIVTKACSP